MDTRLQDLDAALDNMLQIEEAMAARGVINIKWIKRMQVCFQFVMIYIAPND